MIIAAAIANKDNVAHIAPKIDTFLTYANEQLGKRANPSWVLEGVNEDAAQRAIGIYTARWNEYNDMGEKGRGLLQKLEAGGIEAVWEGQYGTFAMVDGKPERSVDIPIQQEPVMVAIQQILSMEYPDEEERNKYLAEKRDYWVKNIQGKSLIPFNQSEKEVDDMGLMDTSAALEVGYMGWLYNQIKGTFQRLIWITLH